MYESLVASEPSLFKDPTPRHWLQGRMLMKALGTVSSSKAVVRLSDDWKCAQRLRLDPSFPFWNF